jgi:hypothetical protein
VNRRDRELASQAKFDAVMAVRRELAERNQHMKLLRDKHWTLEAIGKIYGVSRQRVFQILNDPDSHLVKPFFAKPAPRDYRKHGASHENCVNGEHNHTAEQIPHGTVTGYTYGCRSKADCPSTPSCTEERREYMRKWRQKRRERKAFGLEF